MEEYGRFLALLASSLLVGFVSVILSLVWVFHYREGLSWDGSAGEFNWHPVLIITGFVFIQGIGSWNLCKLKIKMPEMLPRKVSLLALFKCPKKRKLDPQKLDPGAGVLPEKM